MRFVRTASCMCGRGLRSLRMVRGRISVVLRAMLVLLVVLRMLLLLLMRRWIIRFWWMRMSFRFLIRCRLRWLLLCGGCRGRT